MLITLETYPTVLALTTDLDFKALNHSEKMVAVKKYNNLVKTAKKEALELDNLMNFDFQKSQFSDFTSKITNLLEEITQIYSTLRTKSGDSRKLIHAYSFNGVINSVVTVASAIQFMPEEDRKHVLSTNSISMFTLEDIIASAGRTAYYSDKSQSVVPEIFFDTTLLTNAIVQLSTELDAEIIASTLNFNVDNANRNFSSSRDRATVMLNESLALKLLLDEEPQTYGE